MSTRGKIVVAGVLGLCCALLLILPLSLMALPNPKPVKIQSFSGERVGTFLKTDQGLFKLFPYASAQETFPSGAPISNRRPNIYVKYRQLDALTEYGICAYPTNQPVPIDKKVEANRVLHIVPKDRLAPGLYCITAARDGIYGGINYFYFRVGLGSNKRQ